MISFKIRIAGSSGAGEGVITPHSPALETALAIGLVLLIIFGAVVASTVSTNTDLKAVAEPQAVELSVGDVGVVPARRA